MGIIIDISAQLGISPVFVVILLIWCVAWKGFALWRAARLNQPVWFIIFILVTTAGVLEALYLFIFSKAGFDHLSARKK